MTPEQAAEAFGVLCGCGHYALHHADTGCAHCDCSHAAAAVVAAAGALPLRVDDKPPGICSVLGCVQPISKNDSCARHTGRRPLGCECGHYAVQHTADGCSVCPVLDGADPCTLSPAALVALATHDLPDNPPASVSYFKQDVWTAWLAHRGRTGHANLDSEDEYCITCRECDFMIVSEESEDSDAAVETDAVSHPQHYGGKYNTYETIKVTDAWLTPEENLGAMKFQVIKYVSRAGKKDPSKLVEDLQKARFYLDHIITRLSR